MIDIEQIIEKANEILSICNESSNYIFGAGWMGQKLLDAFFHLNIKIDGFIVSRVTEDRINNIKVYSIEETLKLNGTNNVFVALRDQDRELNERLKDIFSKVIPITYPEDIAIIEVFFYLKYFMMKGIDCSKDIISIYDFNFPNPFNKSYDYMLSWAYEAGDLILPELFNDYSRVDEGPYEACNAILANGDVVIDCGANIGLFTMTALKKKCQVYAFEPMPEALYYLHKLSKKNRSLHICPFALSDHIGTADFLIQKSDLLGASLLESHNSIDKKIKVNLTTIDDFVKKNKIKKVDYIKADIEGAERDMLLGACETIERFMPKISICTYHLPDDKEILEDRIKKLNSNYIVKHKWKKLYAYVPENKK